MTQKAREKFKHFENEKSFQGKIRRVCHHFKRLSFAKNCLRLESQPLTALHISDDIKKVLQTVYYTQ